MWVDCKEFSASVRSPIRCRANLPAWSPRATNPKASRIRRRQRASFCDTIQRRTRPSSTGSGTLPPPSTTSWNAR